MFVPNVYVYLQFDQSKLVPGWNFVAFASQPSAASA
jgi:hypothetical protein